MKKAPAFVSTLFISVFLLLQGCATTAQKTAGMRALMQSNQHQLALQEALKELDSNPHGVMENMNVGALRYIIGDYAASNEALEVAKLRVEELYSTSITEQAGATVINDETISFQGDRFEQVFIHLYMALNFINLGQLDSARVEILQAQVKMKEWGEPEDETPFMHYFSGIIFEMLGETDSATVSYRKAVSAYRTTEEKEGIGIPRQLQEDFLRSLASMRLWDEFKQYKNEFDMARYKPVSQKGKGELVVLVGNGMVPQREQKVFQTWAPALALNVRVAVPDYPYPSQTLNAIRIKVEDEYYETDTVANVDGLARAALSDNMAGITTRAIARAVLKKTSEKEVGDQHGFLGQLAMMVVNQSTEIADTRCWNTLPQSFELSRVSLPAGKYNVVIEVVSPAGVVIDRIHRKVSIVTGRKTLISKHWTSPQIRHANVTSQQVSY